ncbi:MAG: DNA polymerase III subunit beta [Candidatus Daviesbacteria bacterium]|nr:DNA polymerase III subunit beta [Candidatus Daviesbacteria bacterium]
MKFTILQQDLIPILSSVSRSAGIRSQLPVLGNVLIEAQTDRIKISATNLEIGVVKSVKADVVEEGAVTIPAKMLVDVIANLSGEKIEINASDEAIEITTPTFSSTLNGISATEFPNIPLSGKQAALLDPKILIKALPEIVFSAAADDGRPVLTGILTEINHKKLQLVATDGYRLAHKSVETESDSSFKALVPRRTFEEVVRLISEDEADSIQIAVSEDQNQVIFSFGNTQISSRLIEGSFPAWEKIVPTEIKARIITSRSELLKAVKLASVFARGEANTVKLQNLKSKLVLTSETKELGNQKKEIDAEVEGEDLQISFSTKYLQDSLSAFNSSQVIIELSGLLSAAIFKPVGEEGLEYIVMPVNLS